MPVNRKLKKSWGIACCRHNCNKLELLVVKKRYTYCFVSFVFGQYSKKDDNKIQSLFNGMTLQEKIDILSMNFEILWYKIWLEFPERVSTKDITQNDKWKGMYKNTAIVYNIPHQTTAVSKLDFYLKKKNKFESTFLPDGGRRLKSLMHNTKHTKLLWEIPKGRKNNGETPLDAAIREFREETSISMSNYTVLFDIKSVVNSYTSLNITYRNEYYMAYTAAQYTPIIHLNTSQISEIDDIRWVSIDEIKFIDVNNKLYNVARRVFTALKSKYKYDNHIRH